ncbi:methionine ABC transporter permease [Ammoniphilus sp. CFH 90114]|uniref:methionine ABC transporter permease n=1 Tax=Ammoniphilus sp. CFH 90114 TaxID=2493665 RepID=UPI00100EFE70|nr:methionine ABC transporter permease [Ammoniphilus sp. CFH 90114]RXT15209.1 ABC transporter permease [Ammoniphilus sp. CFH 90114]
MLTSLFDRSDLYIQSLIETWWMVFYALSISALIGLPLGVLLVVTRPKHIFENVMIYNVLNVIINILRSVPFVILMVAIIPFTKFIVGTAIGVKGAIVPLVVYTAPYIARLMESALLEVDPGIIEAFKSMGASRRQIIWRVMIREARPAISLGLTIATIGLIGATAMAGVIGAGGLGDLAIRYGYQRWELDVMLWTVILLIIIVQGVQSIGNYIAKRLRKN